MNRLSISRPEIMMASQPPDCTTGRQPDRSGRLRAVRWRTFRSMLLIAAVAACESDEIELPGTGKLAFLSVMHVTTETSGVDPDDNYDVELLVSPPEGQDLVSIFSLPAKGSEDIDVLMEWTSYNFSVSLDDVSANCTIPGGNPRTGTANRRPPGVGRPMDTTNVKFSIICVGAGAVRVSNQTTGQDLDADGFTVVVAGVTGHLDTDGEATLTKVPTGANDIEIGGIAANCQVNGPNPRPVTVTRGVTVDVTFDVACLPLTVAVASVLVSPDSADVVAGATTTYTARTFDAGGAELVGRTIAWSVADAGVATVDATTGVVTGVAAGVTTVVATSEGITDDAIVVAVPSLGGNLLVDPGFEGSVQVGPPTAPGVWSGDLAAIVPAEQGITPLDGFSMLRFLASSAQGASYESDSEMFQLVDVRAFRTEIDGGQVKADAAVRVNRIAGPPSDTRFELRLLAFQGDCSTYPPAVYQLNVQQNIDAEDQLGTWEPLTLGAAAVVVPPGTDCLVFLVVARENRINETTGTEFVGQYADMAELRLRR